MSYDPVRDELGQVTKMDVPSVAVRRPVGQEAAQQNIECATRGPLAG